MNIKIDIQNFEKKKLSLSPSGKNTAWSYFNVYSLRDFRDIYYVIYKNSNVRSLSSLLSYCNELRIKSESGKAWSERNLLEIVNALKKTELLDLKSMEPLAAGLFYKSFGLELNPMIGSLAMSLSSLFVVTNALRLRFVKMQK